MNNSRIQQYVNKLVTIACERIVTKSHVFNTEAKYFIKIDFPTQLRKLVDDIEMLAVSEDQITSVYDSIDRVKQYFDDELDSIQIEKSRAEQIAADNARRVNEIEEVVILYYNELRDERAAEILYKIGMTPTRSNFYNYEHTYKFKNVEYNIPEQVLKCVEDFINNINENLQEGQVRVSNYNGLSENQKGILHEELSRVIQKIKEEPVRVNIVNNIYTNEYEKQLEIGPLYPGNPLTLIYDKEKIEEIVSNKNIEDASIYFEDLLYEIKEMYETLIKYHTKLAESGSENFAGAINDY